MPVAIITGAVGLIGSEAVDHFIGQGFDVLGIENDMRARSFGPESSTSHVTRRHYQIREPRTGREPSGTAKSS